MTRNLNPTAMVQLVALLGKRLGRAKDRAEELDVMRQIARHASRYVVEVTQGENVGEVAR